MKKITKTLLVAVLGAMTLGGCQLPTIDTSTTSNPSSTTTPNTSTSTPLTGDQLILDELLAKTVIAQHTQTVKANFTLPAIVKYQEYTGEITWTSDNGAILIDTKTAEDGTRTITAVVVRQADGDVEVNLHAEVKYNEVSATKKFKVTVEKAVAATDDQWGTFEGRKVSSWSEWREAKSGDTIAIQGVVTAAVFTTKYNDVNVFLQDTNGGYYGYGVKMTEDEMNKYFRVGNEVIIEGQKDIYNEFHETKAKTVTGVKVVNAVGDRPTAIDVTEAAKNNDLRKYQSMWVKAKGLYTEESNNSYLVFGDYKFQLYAEQKYCGDAYETVSTAMDTFNVGDTVEVEGVIGCYNADQFHPYSLKKVEGEALSDEQKATLALGLGESSFSNYKDEIKETTEIALNTSNDATLTYALDADADTSVFVLDTTANKLTVNPTSDSKSATVTITATAGDVTKTSTVTLTACANIVITSLADATTIGAAQADNVYTEEKYYVRGTVTEVYNTTYGNMYITDGTTTFTIYGTYDKDGNKYGEMAEADRPVAGDEVIVCGSLGQYKGAAQMKNGTFHKVMKVTSLADATTIGAAQADNVYTEEKYYVRGEITEVYNTTYGNMYITDGTTTFTVYGTYDENGNKYGEMAEADRPVAGDTVVVYGGLGQYKGAAQMKNGTIVAVYPKAETTEPEPEPAEPTVMTIGQALEAEDGTLVSITAIVSNITYAWSDENGNMSVDIKDAEYNSINCYKLATKVELGDEVTVVGTVGSYYGVKQIAAGATATILSSGNEIPTKPVDPIDPSETSVEVSFYDEANLETTNGTSASESYFTELSSLFTAATNINKLYYGKGGGLCFGTSSVVGTVTLTLNKKITKIEVYGARWDSTGDLKINGDSKSSGDYTTKFGALSTVTDPAVFEFAEATDTLALESVKRITVYKIVVYYA